MNDININVPSSTNIFMVGHLLWALPRRFPLVTLFSNCKCPTSNPLKYIFHKVINSYLVNKTIYQLYGVVYRLDLVNDNFIIYKKPRDLTNGKIIVRRSTETHPQTNKISDKGVSSCMS